MNFTAKKNGGDALTQPDVESVLIGQLARNRDCATDDVLVEMERTGGIDSLEGLELAMEAERTFGIKISDGELSKACRSIPDLAALVRSKLSVSDKRGEADQ